MTKQEFIDAIAKAANKYAPKYGIAVISPVIAQACLESAYGTSNKAKHNNFFGLKYRKDRLTCHSGYFKDGSKEQKADGTYYPVTDDWYEFDSLDSGVEGYFQYINTERYSNLKEVTDPYKYLELLKADGYATSLEYVKTVWAVIKSWNLMKYDKVEKEEATMGYTNSPLVSYTKLSPNHSGQRTHAIDRITPHCVVGQCSVETLGNIFASTSREVSSNYGIGVDGRIGMYVEEKNRSWCSSSNANDQRAITIECASDTTEPYAMNSKVYDALIKLCVDICKRNGKKKLIWLGDKDKTLNYNPKSDEMVITVHRWFANKSCPGNWLYARLGDLATKVTAQLGGTATAKPNPDKSISEVAQEVIQGAWGNGDARKNALTAAGYDYATVQAEVNRILGGGSTVPKKSVNELAKEVIAGKWGNGEARKTALTNAGYDYSAVQKEVNRIFGGANTKSIDELAREVIQGKWGNGSERKDRLTKAGYDYNAVQARVNQLL